MRLPRVIAAPVAIAIGAAMLALSGCATGAPTSADTADARAAELIDELAVVGEARVDDSVGTDYFVKLILDTSSPQTAATEVRRAIRIIDDWTRPGEDYSLHIDADTGWVALSSADVTDLELKVALARVVFDLYDHHGDLRMKRPSVRDGCLTATIDRGDVAALVAELQTRLADAGADLSACSVVGVLGDGSRITIPADLSV